MSPNDVNIGASPVQDLALLRIYATSYSPQVAAEVANAAPGVLKDFISESQTINDQIVTIDGATVRTWPELRTILVGLAIGDSLDVVVQRPSGRFETSVLIQGFDRPTVTIQPIAAPSERQRRLLAAWAEGR